MGFLSSLAILGVGGFIGFIIGKLGVNMFMKFKEMQLRKNLVGVLDGSKENNFDLEGKIIKVNRFIVKDPQDKEIIIDLKGGIIHGS